MRDVKFIDHEPPEHEPRRTRGATDWSGYVFGVLSSQPGRWAIVESFGDSRDNANTLKAWAKRHGAAIEAVSRDGTLYARVTA